MVKSQNKWAPALLALLFVMMTLLEMVEGNQKQAKTRPRRIKKSRAGVGKDFSEFLLVIGVIMTCVIAPVFAFFLHSIYKDPASPELARACWKAIKGKLLSYLGGQQPAMPDSSVDRNNASGSSPLLRASRRRKVNTVDSSNEAAFWASDRGAASQSPWPPTVGAPTTDRSQQHPRRYAQDYDRAKDLPRNGNVSFGRRNHPQEKELSGRRPDPTATMAPHSSGALFPPWGEAGRGVETRAGARRETAGAPEWRREGGRRAPPSDVRRAGFFGDTEEYDFGSGRGMEWDPYPDMSYGDEDDDGQEAAAGRGSTESRGVYKSARSKRRMSRSKRARAAKGSSLGDGRGAPTGTGLDGGWARGHTTGGRTSGFS